MNPCNMVHSGVAVAFFIQLVRALLVISIALECFCFRCSGAIVLPSSVDGYNAIRYDINTVSSQTVSRSSRTSFGDVKLEAIASGEDGSSLLFVARRNVIFCIRNPNIRRHETPPDGSNPRDSSKGGDRRQSQLLHYSTAPVNASSPTGSRHVSCNKSRVDGEPVPAACGLGVELGSIDVVPILLVAIPYGGVGEARTSGMRRNDSTSAGSKKRQLVLYCDKKIPSTVFDERRPNVTDDIRCLVFDPTTSSTSGRLRPSGQLNDRTSLVALARAVGSTDRMLYRYGDNVRALISSSTMAASRSRDVTVATGDDAESTPLYVASGGPRPISLTLATVTSLRIRTRRRPKSGNDERAERIDVTVVETGRMELRSRPTWSLGRFPVRYVDGGQFEHGQFVYFVTVQPETVPIAAAGNSTDPVLVTRLIRFCRNDDSLFYSYAELTLSCGVDHMTATSIVRAAHFVPAKSGRRKDNDDSSRRRRLSASDGDYEDDRLLVLADNYQSAVDESNQGGKPVSGVRSVMCVYRMSDLRKEFTRAVKDCFGGRGRLLPWTHPNDQNCSEDRTQLRVIDDDFCGHRSNPGGINVRFPVEPDSIVWRSEQHRGSSLAVSEQNDETIVWIGTVDGHVLKVSLAGSGSLLRPLATVNVVDGIDDVMHASPVVTGIIVDRANEYIYVTTGTQVTRLAASSCSLYADCERCISSRDTLGCAWCDDRCVTLSECALGFPLHRYTETCPPLMTSFQPQSGPSTGGSLLTIHGRYFGGSSSAATVDGTAGTLTGPGPTGAGGASSTSDTASVQIGTTNCTIEFRNFSTIQCRTGAVNSSLSREVKVFVSDFSRTSSSVDIQGFSSSGHESFAYKDVSVTSLHPRYGPKSGGTLVTVGGTNLDVGAQRSVDLVGLPCRLVSVSETEVVCNSSQYGGQLSHLEHGGHGTIEVTVDGVPVSAAETYRFMYTNDPIITSVTPNVSFISGGLPLTVYGSYLDTVRQPTVFIRINGSEYTDTCKSLSDSDTMVCRSPNVSAADVTLPTTSLLQFKMDGSDMSGYSVSVTYSDDPILYNVSCRPINDEHDVFIHIRGDLLNLSATVVDYQVLVGNHRPCNLTLLTDQEIECSLRADFIASTSQVKVFVGGLVFDLGRINCGLEYRSLPSIFSDDPQSGGVTIAVLTTVAVVLLAVFVVLCAVYVAGRARRSRRWPFAKKRSCHMEPNVLYVAGTPTSPAAGPTVNQPAVSEGTTVAPPSRVAPPCGGGRNPYWTRSVPDRERLLAARTRCNSVLDDETRRVLEDSHLLIPRHRLLVLDSIGQGHFGCVFRGLLKFPGQKAEVEVAVKTLRSLTECLYASSVEMRKFLDEALTMTEFNHEHVLRLIGVVVDGDRLPLVVLPFMTHGDLLSFIRDENNSPSVKDLMDFGIQIADGMAYLAGLKFVHRDLAARNCMLDENMVVKVADFGLSRDIYERDYYSSDNHKAKLPVKWMALESLEKSIYNVKTDVWSYGVVLWELMTRGVCPYPDVDNWDIVRFLKSGRRMLQPSYCPTVLYKLMARCWDIDPNRRPSFTELATSVAGIIAEMRAAAEGRVGLDVAYINVIGSSEDISDDITSTMMSLPVDDYLRPLHLPPLAQSSRASDDVSERTELADNSSALVSVIGVTAVRQVEQSNDDSIESVSTPSSEIWMRRELDVRNVSNRMQQST